MCGFEAELTAAEGEGLSVGADIFYGSNVNPARLRNAHVDCMTLINSCRGMALEIVQRSKGPNNAWRNLRSNYRAKKIREILRLSHENTGEAMEPGGDSFEFMMKIDRLATDVHRLGDKGTKKMRDYRGGTVC